MSGLVSLIIKLLIFESVFAGVLFASAGRFDLPWFWAVIAVHTVCITTGMSRLDPALRKERFRPAPGGKDRMLRWAAMPFILAHLIIAGLDAGRYGWSGDVPTWAHAAGFAVYTVGIVLAMWAMTTNQFFSPVVRIQSERGHTLVSTGPYRFVRHPGYLGALLASVGGGIALGSYWSLLPLVPLVGLFVRRTMLEDRFLHAELPGYIEFAKRVRYRLLPGIW